MRTSREQELRAADEVHENYNDSWESPALLDTKHIPARPGFVQRWLRTSIRGDDDQNNVFRKFNQGWRARLLDTVPKGLLVPHIDFKGTQVIGIHGMILAERPIELHERHAEYNRQQTRNQMIAAKENLFSVHQNGSGMGRPEMTTRSKVSTGRLVDPDDD